ncbi:MAG: signal peptidase I [gamma proteobacterium symbiont of Taylorina sp.]|nr:signal peptidase I [gamma proteobacterium symbiont of Taylorina sp.]
MDFDIALVLVNLTFISGLVLILDKLLWEKARRVKQMAEVEKKGQDVTDQERDALLADPVLVDYAKSLFPIFFIVLILRSFIFEPFRIPSQSMMPNLWVGDFILVNKFSYGVRLPVLNKEIIDTGKPKNGDVAVFRYPVKPSINFIKRVIGIPGDHVVYRNKVLYINNQLIPQKMLSAYQGKGSGEKMNGAIYKNENLLGVEHDILMTPGKANMSHMFFSLFINNGNIDLVVPEGHYFVMGDNRDESHDSRFWGLVPEDNLVGKAFLIWFNWDVGQGLFWERIGNTIK